MNNIKPHITQSNDLFYIEKEFPIIKHQCGNSFLYYSIYSQTTSNVSKFKLNITCKAS